MTGRGPERGSPQKATETRGLALRGAAGAKLLQCLVRGDRATPSAPALQGLLRSVKRTANKGWASPVPAAAVTPAPRVEVPIIGSKECVAGRVSLL